MKQEAAMKWVDALRSGKYKQLRGQLRRGDMFCTEGVLCDAVMPEGWKRDGFGQFAHDGRTTGLSAQFARSLGMNNIENPVIYHPVIDGIPVAHWNDRMAKSFAEIADLIEQHWRTI